MELSGKESMEAGLLEKLADLYQKMEREYDRVAGELDFSCNGCPDNCCDSFFLHHTYIEWAYLWHGLDQLPRTRVDELIGRAQKYMGEAERALGRGERPQSMCPLNEEGLCVSYPYRLMICRMHGVPAEFSRPDGRRVKSPGCFRCQELVGAGKSTAVVDRTDLYRELAELENEYRRLFRGPLPKVRMTIAQMIIQGFPQK